MEETTRARKCRDCGGPTPHIGMRFCPRCVERRATAGPRLRALRLGKGISQAELAKKARVSQGLVSGFERGLKGVSLKHERRMFAAVEKFEPRDRALNYGGTGLSRVRRREASA